MTAVRALLEPKAERSSRRTAARRRLHLATEGVTTSGTSDVLILNVSKTGLLLETSGDLAEGETIELDFPEAAGVRAVVKWSSGHLFGCKFQQPLSTAAVSAALLRASHEPADAAPALGALDSEAEERLPFGVRLSWIAGLALLSWALVAGAAAALVWS